MDRRSNKPRKGTSNKGQEYEILLPALFALNFLEDRTITNFVLKSNIQGFGALDDLVITITKINNEEENYAFQIKHKEKQNLRLDPKCLETGSKNSDFSISKYTKDFNDHIQEKDKYRYIIYTNAYFNSTFLKNVSEYNIELTGNCPGKKYFYFPSTTQVENSTTNKHQPSTTETEVSAGIYNFETNAKTKITDKEICKSFLDKFAFYSFQKNWKEIQELITQKFKQMFATTDDMVAMGYIEIFKLWKMHEYSHVEMNKEELKIKILDLILTPYIKTPVENLEKENMGLLERAFSKFDFAFINGLEDSSVLKITSKACFEKGEDVLYLAKNMKLITKDQKKIIGTSKEVDVKQKIGYYQKEKPILVKISSNDVEETVVKTILQFKKKEDGLHFVLFRENPFTKIELPGFTMFENLYDLKVHQKDIYDKLIQEMKIFIREQEYSFGDLFDDVAIDKKVTIKEIFQMLSKKFRITIKDEVLPMPYIPRYLSITLIKIRSIDELRNDIVVISHRGDLEVVKRVNNNLKEKHLSNFVQYLNGISFTEFEQICEENPTRNVHYFSTYDRQCIEWICTKGSIKEIKKCDTLQKNFISEFNTEDRFGNKINVIVASPGMGKSEILKRLKNEYPIGFFPILIIMKEHNVFFKKHTHKDDEILSYFLNYSSDEFFLAEIKKSLVKNKKIVFFFDGFDELQLEDVETALFYMKRLSEMGFRLWISSRSNLKELIEKYLEVFSMNLRTFSEDDQKLYIRERLKGKPNVEDIVTEVFKNLDILEENRDILDLPLQLFMITEIFLDSQDVIGNIFVLTQMFRQFFLGRYRHFFNKTKCTHWDEIEKVINDSILYRMKQYQIAALKTCLSERELQALNLNLDREFLQQIQKDGDFLGIILKLNPQTVIFHHNVTATYFAALWFSENFQTCRPFLKNLLFKQEYIHLRLLFDMILAEKSPAHLAVLYRNINALENYNKDIHSIDNGGRTTLHLACSHGCINAFEKKDFGSAQSIEYFKSLKKIDAESRQIVKILLDQNVDPSKTDNVFKWTCLDFSSRTCYVFLEMILRETDEKYNQIKNEICDLDEVKRCSFPFLNICAIFEYPYLFRQALQNSEKSPEVKPESSSQLLQTAAALSNCEIVSILLDNNQTDIQSSDKRGRTILHISSTFGYTELTKLLLYKNADVNAYDSLKRTPLHAAASRGHIQIAKMLIDFDANVDCLDRYGRAPLHLAAKRGHDEFVIFLIDQKHAEVTIRAFNGWGPLEFAISEGHVSMVKILLASFCEFDEMDVYGLKPLHLAVQRGNIEILKILLEKVKNIDNVTRDGKTSLHLAVETGNLTILEFLLQNGANINASDNNNRSVLHTAVISGRLEIVDFLLERRVEVEVVDINGRNCLQWAAEHGHLGMIQLLIEKMGHLINQQAKNGSTALHWAACNGHDEIVEVLISKNAEIDILDKEDRSALYWAATDGHVETVELLLKKKAHDISIGGRSALQFAIFQRSKSC